MNFIYIILLLIFCIYFRLELYTNYLFIIDNLNLTSNYSSIIKLSLLFIALKVIFLSIYILFIYWVDYSLKYNYIILYTIVHLLSFIVNCFLYSSVNLESKLRGYELIYYELINSKILEFMGLHFKLINPIILDYKFIEPTNLEVIYLKCTEFLNFVNLQFNINNIINNNIDSSLDLELLNFNGFPEIGLEREGYNCKAVESNFYAKNGMEVSLKKTKNLINSVIPIENRISIQKYSNSVSSDKKFTVCDKTFFSGILGKSTEPKATLLKGVSDHFFKYISIEIDKALGGKKVLLPDNKKILLNSNLLLPETLNYEECKDFFNSNIIKYKKLAANICQLEEGRQIIILNSLHKLKYKLDLIDKVKFNEILKEMNSFFSKFETLKNQNPFKSAKDFANGAENHPIIASIDSDGNYRIHIISHIDKLLNSNVYNAEVADLILEFYGFIDFGLDDKSKISKGMIYYNNNLNIKVKFEEDSFGNFFYKVKDIANDANLVAHLEETKAASVSEFLFESLKLNPDIKEITKEIDKIINEEG